MGKSTRKALTPAKSEAEDPGPAVPKVNLNDGSSLKRALDEAAVDALTSAGYTEDHFVGNVKIGSSLFLCLLAAIAQFWPQKFPDNWTVLATCVALYGFGTVALNLFTSQAEGDAFLFLRSESSPTEAALRVSSKLPRFTYKYELTVSGHQGGANSAELDIQECFTSDGRLVDNKLKDAAAGLLQKSKLSSTKKSQ